MCAEVVAGQFAALEYSTLENAAKALSDEMRGQRHGSFLKMKWLGPDDAVR